MPQTTHDAIVSFGRSLDYPINLKGCCTGFTLKWLEACFLHEEQQFKARVKIICASNHQLLKNQIFHTKAKISRGEKPSKAEYALSEIPAFYEGIELYLSAGNHDSIFGESVLFHNFAKISQFAASKKIEQLGGLTTIYTEAGIYTEEELTKHLDNLKNAIKYHQQNVGILLINYNHVIGLHYDIKNQTWSVMDINQWPPYQSDDNLSIAKKIMAGFKMVSGLTNTLNNLFSSFNTIIISPTLKQHPALTAQLTKLRNHHLSLITKELAQRRDVTNMLYIATDLEDLDAVNQLLAKDADPTITIPEGFSSLHICAQRNHLTIAENIIKTLVEKDKTEFINRVLPSGSTPLLDAIANEHFKMANLLIKAIIGNKGIADLRVANVFSNMPFYVNASMISDYFRELRLAVTPADYRRLLTRPNDAGCMPLYLAANTGKLEIVEMYFTELETYCCKADIEQFLIIRNLGFLPSCRVISSKPDALAINAFLTQKRKDYPVAPSSRLRKEKSTDELATNRNRFHSKQNTGHPDQEWTIQRAPYRR